MITHVHVLIVKDFSTIHVFIEYYFLEADR